MRIALIAPYPPQQNGIADYAKSLADSLGHQGVVVETPLAGLSLNPADLPALSEVLAQIDWSRFDLIHAEVGGGRLVEFHALRWLQTHQPAIAKTLTLHDPERVIWQSPHVPSWIKRLPPLCYKLWTLLTDKLTLRAERAFCLGFNQIIVLTNTGKARLVKRLQLPAEKVTVIQHGCLEIPPAPLPPLPPEGPLVLMYFGFLYRGKGIEDLLDAIALLVKQHPATERPLHLILAGGTKPDIAFGSSGSYVDEIRARLKQLQIEHLSISWKLDIPQAEIAPTMQSAHMVVLPYIETKKLARLGKMCGTSGVLAWANACGRGVISSDARAFSEEVSYGNGIIFPQRNIQALANAMKSLLENPSQINTYQIHAEAQGIRRAWSQTGKKFADLFALQIQK